MHKSLNSVQRSYSEDNFDCKVNVLNTLQHLCEDSALCAVICSHIIHCIVFHHKLVFLLCSQCFFFQYFDAISLGHPVSQP